MALKVFKTMRAGLESTRGTNVAPTRGLEFAEGTHTQEVETIYPLQYRNSYFGHYSASQGTETNSFEFEGGIDFDQFHWWLNTHVKAVASGTGAGSDKTWTFLPSGTTDDLKTATIQFGYTDAIGATRPAWELGYCMGDELSITWDKQPGAVGVGFRSRMLSPEAATQISAFTGVGTYQTSELAKATTTQVWIDTTTIGTTADPEVMSVEWTLNTGAVNLYTLNNTTAAQRTVRPMPWDWTATIRRYYNDDTENDAYVAKTTRKIRVRSLGSVLGGSNYALTLDLYGIYTARSWAEVDGMGVEEYTLRGKYDSGLTSDFQVVLVNSQASIT